jgi:hypothetical protein
MSPLCVVTEKALLGQELGDTGPTIPATHYLGLLMASQWVASTVIASGAYYISTAFNTLQAATPSSTGRVFKCTTGGTTGATEPTGFTAGTTAAGATVTDGTVTWTEVSGLFGAGTFTGAEPALSRTDAGCGTTSGSATVTDTAIAAADFGKAVTGAGIPANTFVGTVTASTSFLLSSSPTSQVNVNATATASVSLTIANGYAREAIVNNTTNWPVPTQTGAAPSQVANGVAVSFPTSTAAWGAYIVGQVLFDAATAGNARSWGCTPTKSGVVAVATGGVTPQFAISALVATMS